MSAATCGLSKQVQTSKQVQPRISLRLSGLQSIRATCLRESLGIGALPRPVSLALVPGSARAAFRSLSRPRQWLHRSKHFAYQRCDEVDQPATAAPVMPESHSRVNVSFSGGRGMKKVLAVVAVALAFAPVGAFAQERGGDAALGAMSGAVVFGPIGAVAGAVIGYTAGPGIAHSWGMREPRRRERSARRSDNKGSSAIKGTSALRQAPVPQPASKEASASRQPRKQIAAQPAQSSAQSAARSTVMVPVQTLE